MKYLSLILLLSTVALADDWLCKSQASERRGNEVYACGIGEGPTEDAARSNAFTASQGEFNRLCSASADCKGQPVTADPRRSDCSKEGQGYKCYRLIVWSIGRAFANGGPLPKVFLKKGMPRKALVELMGSPTSVIPNTCKGGSNKLFVYDGNPKCNGHCTVCLGYSDEVDTWDGVKPQFTEDVR